MSAIKNIISTRISAGFWVEGSRQMQIHWYTLPREPNREKLLYRPLGLRGIGTFTPCIRARAVNLRTRRRNPHIPGYFPVPMDHTQTGDSALQRIPGTTVLVPFGGEPARVPGSLVYAIQTRMEDINAGGIEISRAQKSVNSDLIRNRPFTGFEAIFDSHISGKEGVRVLPKPFQDRNVPSKFRSGQIADPHHGV